MVGLDTNVLIRWLAADEGSKGQSANQTGMVERAVLETKDGCFVNAVVVAETLWVVANTFRQPKAVQIEIVERLLFSQNVAVGDRDAVEAALNDFKSNNDGGFADNLIGTLNSFAGCSTTLTFDKRAARGRHFTKLK